MPSTPPCLWLVQRRATRRGVPTEEDRLRKVRLRSWTVKCLMSPTMLGGWTFLPASRPKSLDMARFSVSGPMCGNLLRRLAGKTYSELNDLILSSLSHSMAWFGRGMEMGIPVLTRCAGRCQTLCSRSNSDHGASQRSLFLFPSTRNRQHDR